MPGSVKAVDHRETRESPKRRDDTKHQGNWAGSEKRGAMNTAKRRNGVTRRRLDVRKVDMSGPIMYEPLLKKTFLPSNISYLRHELMRRKQAALA